MEQNYTPSGSHIPAGAHERPRPQVAQVFTGAEQQVMQGSSDVPAFMPGHSATHEAAVIVVEGAVDIHYTEAGTSVSLQAGECHTIEPGQWHALSSPDAFRLYLIMPAAGEIRFDSA
jgi:quercetin dioxygenase-like cupin family protein